MDQDRTEELGCLVGTCDVFKVVSVIESGAFVYCSMAKDLFIPVGEQLKLMKVGESHPIYVYRDEKTGRVAGSSKLNKYLFDDAPDGMLAGDEVDLIIYSLTDMGFKAVIAGDCWGVLYKNEVFQELKPGQKITGFIKKIRADGRIDLSLTRPGFQSVPDLSEKILSHLRSSGGSAALTDKTPPEEIHRLFGVSKKKFKMAVGSLYRQRMLVIDHGGIKLIDTLQRR